MDSTRMEKRVKTGDNGFVPSLLQAPHLPARRLVVLEGSLMPVGSHEIEPRDD